MLMFSRRGEGGAGREAAAAPAPNMFNRATAATRDGRASVKKLRPHSWHSTLQRGLARARSRSAGRERERDRVKRASSALNSGNKILA